MDLTCRFCGYNRVTIKETEGPGNIITFYAWCDSCGSAGPSEESEEAASHSWVYGKSNYLSCRLGIGDIVDVGTVDGITVEGLSILATPGRYSDLFVFTNGEHLLYIRDFSVIIKKNTVGSRSPQLREEKP